MKHILLFENLFSRNKSADLSYSDIKELYDAGLVEYTTMIREAWKSGKLAMVTNHTLTKHGQTVGYRLTLYFDKKVTSTDVYDPKLFDDLNSIRKLNLKFHEMGADLIFDYEFSEYVVWTESGEYAYNAGRDESNERLDDFLRDIEMEARKRNPNDFKKYYMGLDFSNSQTNESIDAIPLNDLIVLAESGIIEWSSVFKTANDAGKLAIIFWLKNPSSAYQPAAVFSDGRVISNYFSHNLSPEEVDQKAMTMAFDDGAEMVLFTTENVKVFYDNGRNHFDIAPQFSIPAIRKAHDMIKTNESSEESAEMSFAQLVELSRAGLITKDELLEAGFESDGLDLTNTMLVLPNRSTSKDGRYTEFDAYFGNSRWHFDKKTADSSSTLHWAARLGSKVGASFVIFGHTESLIDPDGPKSLTVKFDNRVKAVARKLANQAKKG